MPCKAPLYQLAALGSTSDTKPFDQCIVGYMTNVITLSVLGRLVTMWCTSLA